MHAYYAEFIGYCKHIHIWHGSFLTKSSLQICQDIVHVLNHARI
jgi:hypothetical protein